MKFYRPKTIEQAIELLADSDLDARVMAGGTDLIVQMKSLGKKPGAIISLKDIPELNTVTEENGAFSIGAAVCGAEIFENKRLRNSWPGVVEAIDLIGSMQVQGRATPAGNLCNASPAADSVPAMIAAGAMASVAGPEGRREVPVADIPTGPGSNSLRSDELIVCVNLSARAPRSGDAYLRLIPRSEMDIAVAGAGVNLTLNEDGVCTAARVAIGAVAPTALLVEEAGHALVDTKLEEPALQAAAVAASAACSPINDRRGTVEYRIETAGVLVKRATRLAAKRAIAMNPSREN